MTSVTVHTYKLIKMLAPLLGYELQPVTTLTLIYQDRAGNTITLGYNFIDQTLLTLKVYGPRWQ